ncbi:hypothetical protein ASE16_03575 [Leifsonia sp. Root227]|uniref:hypothetical protein n=1 Tax=Leifsonia sp. Root227 TaxID=1736496 RepID=UPI000700883D|nr:hypothetical protein [Leifsonia sp. Root227]KRC52141.1 hypothetical protein ASE16_03575 [Leifsonia sp. Root227]
MAIVKIKDATVTRVNSKGYGVKVTESNESNGKRYKTQYTLWFKEPHGLSEGDVVSVDGFLGAKVGEPWEDRDGNQRVSVELSVNNPKLDGYPKAPVEEQWAAPTNNDETPF